MSQKIIVEFWKVSGKDKAVFYVDKLFSVTFNPRSYKFDFVQKGEKGKYVLRINLYRTDKIVWQLINKNEKITQTKIYNFKEMINQDAVQIDHQKAAIKMIKNLNSVLLKYKGR